MIKGNEELSATAKVFCELLKEKSPDLLEIAEVKSPSKETPLIQEPGSIVIVIPARQGFLAEELYAETRREDILIAVGSVTHYHFSWYSEEVMGKYMLNAIQFINDILSEQVVFARRKTLIFRKEYIDDIRIEDLGKKKRILAVYSWKGTYNSLSNCGKP